VKSSLDENDKLIQSLKKKLKMFSTEHPQKIELVALEQEKEAFRQEALNYQARVLQLEQEKVNWTQGQTELLNMVVAVPPIAEAGPSNKGLVQTMSQVSLKAGEIKGLKGDIEKLKQEMKVKDEIMAQFQKDNQAL
jgi:hypothetical protein